MSNETKRNDRDRVLDTMMRLGGEDGDDTLDVGMIVRESGLGRGRAWAAICRLESRGLVHLDHYAGMQALDRTAWLTPVGVREHPMSTLYDRHLIRLIRRTVADGRSSGQPMHITVTCDVLDDLVREFRSAAVAEGEDFDYRKMSGDLFEFWAEAWTVFVKVVS